LIVLLRRNTTAKTTQVAAGHNPLLGFKHCHNRMTRSKNITTDNIMLSDPDDYIGCKICRPWILNVFFILTYHDAMRSGAMLFRETFEFRPEYDMQCERWSLGVRFAINVGGYRLRVFRIEAMHPIWRVQVPQTVLSTISEEAKILISMNVDAVSPYRPYHSHAAIERLDPNGI
jgi:hypothetical protein